MTETKEKNILTSTTMESQKASDGQASFLCPIPQDPTQEAIETRGTKVPTCLLKSSENPEFETFRWLPYRQPRSNFRNQSFSVFLQNSLSGLLSLASIDGIHFDFNDELRVKIPKGSQSYHIRFIDLETKSLV